MKVLVLVVCLFVVGCAGMEGWVDLGRQGVSALDYARLFEIVGASIEQSDMTTGWKQYVSLGYQLVKYGVAAAQILQGNDTAQRGRLFAVVFPGSPQSRDLRVEAIVWEYRRSVSAR